MAKRQQVTVEMEVLDGDAFVTGIGIATGAQLDASYDIDLMMDTPLTLVETLAAANTVLGDGKLARVARVMVEMEVLDGDDVVASTKISTGEKLDGGCDIDRMMEMPLALIEAQAQAHIDPAAIIAAQLAACTARLDAVTDRLIVALAEFAEVAQG